MPTTSPWVFILTVVHLKESPVHLRFLSSPSILMGCCFNTHRTGSNTFRLQVCKWRLYPHHKFGLGEAQGSQALEMGWSKALVLGSAPGLTVQPANC